MDANDLVSVLNLPMSQEALDELNTMQNILLLLPMMIHLMTLGHSFGEMRLTHHKSSTS
jgi:hypothetical protein